MCYVKEYRVLSDISVFIHAMGMGGRKDCLFMTSCHLRRWKLGFSLKVASVLWHVLINLNSFWRFTDRSQFFIYWFLTSLNIFILPKLMSCPLQSTPFIADTVRTLCQCPHLRESVIMGVYFSQSCVIYFCVGYSCCPLYLSGCLLWQGFHWEREMTVFV